MADDPNPTPSPDPQPPPDPAPDPTAPDPGDLEGLDERARRLVERANAEAAQRRRELREAQTRAQTAERELATYRQAQETETEKLIREAEQRGAASVAGRLLDAEVTIAAAGRMRYPQDAGRLLSEARRAELLAIEDSDERARAAEAAVAELLEARPEMSLETNGGTRPLVTQGGRSAPPGSSPKTPDDWLREVGRR
jgi:hypothetical protein